MSHWFRRNAGRVRSGELIIDLSDYDARSRVEMRLMVEHARLTNEWIIREPVSLQRRSHSQLGLAPLLCCAAGFACA